MVWSSLNLTFYDPQNMDLKIERKVDGAMVEKQTKTTKVDNKIHF